MCVCVCVCVGVDEWVCVRVSVCVYPISLQFVYLRFPCHADGARVSSSAKKILVQIILRRYLITTANEAISVLKIFAHS